MNTLPALPEDLAANQPSVSRIIFAVRLGNVVAGLGGVALAVTAWASGSVAWLIAYLIYSAVLFAGVAVATAIPRRRQRELDQAWAGRFHELAIRDDLTGLYNRRYFNQQLAALIASCRETHQPLSVAMIDLNHFKTINDTFGHHAGDLVLQAVASTIASATSGGAVAARTGGDEFTVIFPGLEAGEAARKVREVQAQLDGAELVVDTVPVTTTRISAAVGIASLEEFGEAERLLRHADNALYANKRQLRQLSDRRKAS